MTATLPGGFMTTEKVLAGLLEPGDVICVHHHHDSRCGQCLAPWQTEAVVTGKIAPVAGRLVVNWAAGIRPPGGPGAVTGVSVFSPDEQVVRIGRPPTARRGALALAREGVVRRVQRRQFAEQPGHLSTVGQPVQQDETGGDRVRGRGPLPGSHTQNLGHASCGRVRDHTGRGSRPCTSGSS